MSNVYDKQVAKMKHLIDFGNKVNESKAVKPSVECQSKAADGKTYAILREGNRYYIKCCPPKQGRILAEDYEYIGGELNKKANEFTSYANASKSLGIKVQSINEAYRRRTAPVQSRNVSQWEVPETTEVREAIDRFNEISNNVAHIMNEDAKFTMSHTVPEAPAKNPGKQKVNTPFVQDGVADGDKEFKKSSKDHKGKGPFTTEPGTGMKSHGDAFGEKPRFALDNDITGKRPRGGKTVKLTTEQINALSGNCLNDSCGMDEECGETQYDLELDPGHGECCDPDDPYCECGGRGRRGGMCEDKSEPDRKKPAAPKKKKKKKKKKDEFYTSPKDMKDLINDFDTSFGGLGPDGDLLDDGYQCCSVKHGGRRVNEDYKYFGKHPSYRKSPMTGTARNTRKNFGREWDDSSVADENGYGRKIGSSLPFGGDAIDGVTDEVFNQVVKAIKKKV